MTFEQKAIQLMTERGMFDDDAKKVLEQVKQSRENEVMLGRWHDEIENYPLVSVNVLWFTVANHALKYIDANFPKAWYRPLFDVVSTETQL